MATPNEKLAQSLELLNELQERGKIAIRTDDLSRAHRERLTKNGFLREVMKGWYIPTRPDEPGGESTAWYASFWRFCTAYLNARFDNEWCLSPEQSLCLHSGNRTVPRQLVVRAPRAGKNVTNLIHDTSIVDIVAALPEPKDADEAEGMRVFALPAALVGASPAYFAANPTDARTALAMIRSTSDILDRLLEGGHTVVAGRLAGAFRNIGRDRIADDIIKTMRAAGYDSRESDPFEAPAPILIAARSRSAIENRIRLMWREMREPTANIFPNPPGRPNDIEAYLERVEEAYVTDAYHSLSIEGYRVSPELIDRVRAGGWRPDDDQEDKAHADALAARGYWQAFQSVQESLRNVLEGEAPGAVADDDHGAWYREMFAPSVTAGILRPADLAGYRSSQVYIRKSMHVPPHYEAVRDAMPTFFELLGEEEDPKVRVVLGHFVFVYIHPYMDGNGRMSRFLMNVMLAAAGYPWTIIRVEDRDAYVSCLETASVDSDIRPFARFVGERVAAALEQPLK